MQPLRWEPCRALAGTLAGAVVHGRDPGSPRSLPYPTLLPRIWVTRECWCGAVAALPYLICKLGHVPCSTGSACLDGFFWGARIRGQAPPLILDRTRWLQLTVFAIHLQSLGGLHTAGHLPGPPSSKGRPR